MVEHQTDADVKIMGNTGLTFKTDVAGENYYIVYSWGDGNPFFSEFDIRGH